MSATSDPYERIAAYYDCEHESFREDIDFYLAQIDGGPILEIGAGTGRVCAALAASGMDVVGVDPSPAMLRRARFRASGIGRVQLVEGTIADIDRQPCFATAIITLNVLWHAGTQQDQLHVLRETRERLVPGGRLFADFSNPLNLADRAGNGTIRKRFGGECEGGRLDVTSAAWDDHLEQKLTLAITYDVTGTDGLVRRTVTDLSLRYAYRPELELMLRAAGFRVDNIYGSYDLEEYADDSPNLLLVATAI